MKIVGMESQKGRLNLVTTGFNRNVFEFRRGCNFG